MIIHSHVFEFLSALEHNNTREWFHDNRSLYEKSLESISDFTNELIHGISEFDSAVSNETIKTSLFRIYRDLRFTPDKRPYKTHFGIYVVKGGKASPLAGYYLHIQNNSSELAGGLWSPHKDVLAKVRQEIYYEPEKFVKIINDKVFVDTFKGLSPLEKLKILPRTFSGDFPYNELLKYKHYIVAKSFTNEEILNKNFIRTCIDTCKLLYPFNHYFNTIIQ
ncbi:MAG: DUF2461 domain-containing protein [Bacteroidales bacterium]|jgi:uncharacterized protein (TIGR02453 family)|nr:DUF2461 domain-containing protein [Bacteroidales bacterium]MDD2686919.1 DUF2461 domain-containing protein [Bacteroidales bacterium]MDD3330046.1 DUF2461 domain-containing protein [Bacteroidales bacterium]MDD3690852.1 DUF2461 domain-containing protein [Bacteroidales bacterium]MDD4044140.1 DUF2461 domain-containing protein [Bacteroidales bacterium]